MNIILKAEKPIYIEKNQIVQRFYIWVGFITVITFVIAFITAIIVLHILYDKIVIQDGTSTEIVLIDTSCNDCW